MALTAPSSTLTGQTIAASYDQVLFLDAAAGVTEATLKIVSGTTGKTALSISDEHVLVKGVDTNNAAGFEVQQTDGTSILKIAAGTPSATLLGPLTVGADDLGHDVIFYGDTASSNMTWDTSGDDLILNDARLFINQDDNATALEIDTEATTGIGIFIDTPATTSVPVLKIADCDSLTTGQVAYFHSNAIAGTRNLVEIVNDHLSATGTTALKIRQDADNMAVSIAAPNSAPATSGTTQVGNLRLEDSSSSDNVMDMGTQSASPYGAWIQVADRTALGTEYPLILQPNGGNVGINIAAPLQKLHVEGNVRLGDTYSVGWGGVQSQIVGSNASDYLDFQTNATSRIRIANGGNVGIGGTPATTTHLQVQNDTINTSSDFYGIYANHTKTLGSSSVGDLMTGLRSYMVFNDADAAYSNIIAGSFEAIGQSSTGECVGIRGIDVTAAFTAGDINSIYGTKTFVDVNGGTVDSTVYGLGTAINIDGATLSGHVYGHLIDINTTVNPSGDVRGLNITMAGSAMDATGDLFFLCHDGVNDDVVAQITAVAGVATFDSGDFSGAPDYAEYFESKDGNAIAVGKTVKLDGDKVVACSEGDTPIGVVRPDGVGTSAYKAGAQNLRWHGKYLYDDFNELQHEDYTIKKWIEEITFDEYIARGKDETGGVLGGSVKDSKVEGSKSIEAKDAVEAVEAHEAVYETVTKQHQKVVVSEVEEEVSSTEIVLEDGKYVQKTTTETVTIEVETPQYEEVTLYDEDGEEIGTHQVPIMEDYEEEQLVSEAVTGVVGIAAVEAVDAVPDTYFREHNYHSDRIPDGVTVPDDAETVTPNHQRKKLNPDYDHSKVDDYKSRPERDEWNLIGLLGQIPITKGQPLSDNWIKMKDVSDTVEMYFVK